MQFIKSVLFFILIICLVGAGGYVAIRYIPAQQLNPAKAKLAEIQPVVQEKLASVHLGNISLANLPQVGTVLGIKTESEVTGTASSSSKSGAAASLPQKTFDYARYAYCQQVVKDYEVQNKINTSNGN